MCGIFFSCSRDEKVFISQAGLQLLRNRGPDSDATVSRAILSPAQLSDQPEDRPILLTFYSTVLSLRGHSVVSQPLQNARSGSLMCWNGEAWKVQHATIDNNDAQVIFNLFLRATEQPSDCQVSQHIVSLLGNISGPFSFLFYDARFHRIFFGRDALGRRSLAIKNSLPESLALSSICDPVDRESWSEVEADGLYVLDLHDALKPLTRPWEKIVHIPWKREAFDIGESLCLLSPFPEFNKDIRSSTNTARSLESHAVDNLFKMLHNSLLLRLENIPLPPAEEPCLSRVAILFSGGLDCTVLARLAHEILPVEQDIDLLNVAFENPRVMKAAASRLSSPASSRYDLCPDRLTGLSSYQEIQENCPGRTWRFVAIDVPYVELQAHRARIISLIYPHDTEMDFSIGCALHFAARGIGKAQDATGEWTKPYTTPARVLLSGLGADELFGGYTRHAIAFNRKGYAGLTDELQLDFSRLGKRNLGRDDRVISNWGKEVRYPYLDEKLVSWALEIPVWEKCGYGQPVAVNNDTSPILEPSKLLLRLLAWKLNLRRAAMEKKRAIQFGARTAKMNGGKTKGTATLE